MCLPPPSPEWRGTISPTGDDDPAQEPTLSAIGYKSGSADYWRSRRDAERNRGETFLATRRKLKFTADSDTDGKETKSSEEVTVDDKKSGSENDFANPTEEAAADDEQSRSESDGVKSAEEAGLKDNRKPNNGDVSSRGNDTEGVLDKRKSKTADPRESKENRVFLNSKADIEDKLRSNSDEGKRDGVARRSKARADPAKDSRSGREGRRARRKSEEPGLRDDGKSEGRRVRSTSKKPDRREEGKREGRRGRRTSQEPGSRETKSDDSIERAREAIGRNAKSKGEVRRRWAMGGHRAGAEEQRYWCYSTPEAPPATVLPRPAFLNASFSSSVSN